MAFRDNDRAPEAGKALGGGNSLSSSEGSADEELSEEDGEVMGVVSQERVTLSKLLKNDAKCIQLMEAGVSFKLGSEDQDGGAFVVSNGVKIPSPCSLAAVLC